MKIFRPQHKVNNNWELLLMLLFGLICGACLSTLLQRARKSTDPTYSQYPAPEDFTSSQSVSTSISNATTRILCMIVSSSLQSRALHIERTWGRRCHKLLFMGNPADNTAKLRERHTNSWTKTRAHLQHVYQHYYDDYDWFLKVPDDTYVIMENLQHFLASHSPESPIYFGSNDWEQSKQGFVSGAAGYVFSKAALHRFINLGHGNGNLCSNRSYGIDHVELSRCLRNAGVIAGDSRDEDGLLRFLPVPPYKSHGLLSSSAISFHYSNVEDFYMLDYVIYQLHPFGLSRDPPQHQLKVIPQKWPIELANISQLH
ncbi:glycoprotein-N-acetylgalactosamine 3-beta-galactosyltransferase 1-like [Drosophila albomicans]|uniref:N-acetylgalactosaminide beta-1,3-galactosyltransferase n=1 Tax=Drosophila albomicans TaxID=7291 RepID=A0A6P8W9J1_DROAB|nr:glycoprotein-N-acetylgalactosamine 3-beta-galactosyltransferase 1-like [Drosophila albomicans]